MMKAQSNKQHSDVFLWSKLWHNICLYDDQSAAIFTSDMEQNFKQLLIKNKLFASKFL